MAKYKVEITGINTNEINVLSNEKMTELFKRLQENDEEARNLLVQGNLKLVLSILKKFVNRTDNMDDLFQIGCIGLLKAIDNFDLSHEVKFSTYAVPMILGEVRRYIRDNNTIRVSRSLKDIAYKALKIKEKYLQDTGMEPSIDYVAEKLEISSNEIINALEALKEPVSMFEPVYNDGGDTIYLYDQIEDKQERSQDFSNRIALDEAMDMLDTRERQILDNRFIIGKTQMEIADEIGISQAQVSRLEKRAIKQLKKVLK
ncbi:MAG: RNA polymerase sporulation sigma factor SigG [Tenericutes bacterium]|nr:RNA polymerase sporulation sigma factor SigG [Mycoplasmatota bacterium]MDD6942262.1 RNA polymerase sporulation sigma factor SigG [bacterium]MDY2697561.1 RNA polymerase sporulation sigma factor SigG [Bacilli bacterium]